MAVVVLPDDDTWVVAMTYVSTSPSLPREIVRLVLLIRVQLPSEMLELSTVSMPSGRLAPRSTELPTSTVSTSCAAAGLAVNNPTHATHHPARIVKSPVRSGAIDQDHFAES